jgi:hypothetical protein
VCRTASFFVFLAGAGVGSRVRSLLVPFALPLPPRSASPSQGGSHPGARRKKKPCLKRWTCCVLDSLRRSPIRAALLHLLVPVCRVPCRRCGASESKGVWPCWLVAHRRTGFRQPEAWGRRALRSLDHLSSQCVTLPDADAACRVRNRKDCGLAMTAWLRDHTAAAQGGRGE